MKELKALLVKESKKSGKDWKLIGFYDSPDINSRLILLSIATGQDKSVLLREAVNHWLCNFNPAVAAATTIRNKLLVGKTKKLDSTVLKDIEKFLQKKGVSKTFIQKVIKELT